MRCFAVGDLVAHSGPQHEGTAVPKLGEQFALQAVHDVPLGTPVIRDVAGRVLDDSDSKIPAVECPPDGRATLAAVFRTGNISPVGRLERNIRQLHRHALFRVAACASESARRLGGTIALMLGPLGSRRQMQDLRAGTFIPVASPVTLGNDYPSTLLIAVCREEACEPRPVSG